MGSSKKHKEEKKKKRHRSRSRSREKVKGVERGGEGRRDDRGGGGDRDRDGRHHHKKHRGAAEKESTSSRRKDSHQDHGSERKTHSKEEVIDLEDGEIDMPKLERLPQAPPPPRIRSDSPVENNSGGGSTLSLSINETNRLRAKLGLKPLQLDSDGPKQEGGAEESKSADKDFVHKPPENISDVKRTQAIRERLEERREKRRVEAKLSKVKTLAATEDPEVDNAAAWVERTRRIQQEKEKAEQRAKALEELDAEFGVGDLVQSEFQREKNFAYGARDLTGLRVQHDTDKFVEGRDVILTIKDKGVLEDGEDVLVNVNLMDEERFDKNAEIKKMKPYLYGYNAYEENEVDEYGIVKKKQILAKYDEEIEGEKKASFVIGTGEAPNKDREVALIRLKLQKKTQDSLNTAGIQPATDYFTPEEMVTFKKPTKKIRKVVRKRKVLKADDLILMADTTPKDQGSRKAKEDGVESKRLDERDLAKGKKEAAAFRKRLEVPMDLDEYLDTDDLAYPTEDLSEVQLEPDDLEIELQNALNKTRKMKQKEQRKTALIEKVDEDIKAEPADEDGSLAAGKGFIVLNSTAEFCRTLGDIPTYGLAGNREEDEEEMMVTFDFEKESVEEKPPRMEEETNRGAWNEVEIDETPVEIKSEEIAILDEEPDVGSGLAGALRLAVSKGYLERESKKNVSATRMKHLEAQHYSIEDKTYFDDDKFGRREHYAGPSSEFKEKDTYKPDVKLEYIDDDGRLLNPKEAFRYLSHKFHGKGPGKNKVEKRHKKREQEMLMKQMSSTDTPLGTLTLLQHKQKETQSPFIVLSGNKSTLTAISKPKV